MTYQYDFSNLSDYELMRQYASVSADLGGKKTYWDTQAVGRDHNRWSQMRAEIKKRGLADRVNYDSTRTI